ncbi:aldo/keto reductase [Phenylobacterium sp.]|uniref:aldo/keto reductase n=1 Tax=Phenylobacterium sp. TaxID=1871053 RepID=UPI002723E377|nr:aldo/keto reductase [Phenylobacterium sp.]MDO8377990.1 aldo/keto reductase [Phenylobacterium sp.]
MTDQTFLTLNDGRLMPQVGLGVWQSPAETTADTVATALAAGYLAIDTAAAYRNEPGVGEGVRRSGVARDKLFITTKLWNENQGYDAALAAFDKSLSRLGMDYVDLYLIHWPAPTQDLYLESWKALIRLREEGRAKSIGVSNFAIPHLERIIGETGVTPAANQIELHPRWQQAQLRTFHAGKGIATTSWSPLGQGRLLDDPVIGGIAAKHGKTPAQVIIRWHVDLGLTVIPKSVTPARIVANFQVFDFALDAEDLKAIAGLQAADGRIGPDPNAFG